MRIIRRLGWEKQLAVVERNLGLFTGLFAGIILLSIFAFIGLMHELVESSFGPFLALIFSDPVIVFKYWHSFIFSVFESMPGISIISLILTAAFLMLCVRLISVNFQKFLALIKLIRKQKHTYVK